MVVNLSHSLSEPLNNTQTTCIIKLAKFYFKNINREVLEIKFCQFYNTGCLWKT